MDQSLVDNRGKASGLNIRPPLKKGGLFSAHDTGLITLLPTLAAIAVLLLIPGLYTIWLSLYDRGVTIRGFRALKNDTLFYESIFSSFLYAACTVALQLILGTFTAAVVHR